MNTPLNLGPELRYLEAFHLVSVEGGFAAAARRLRCTQPAVSYRIRALEGILKVKLIERGGRRLVLTPEGERFRAFAERVFSQLDQIRHECIWGPQLDPLRLGSASGFGRYVLVPALHALRAERDAERLRIRLQFEAADVVLHRLEEGDYDAAFVYKRKVSNLLRYRAIYDEELVLIGPSPWPEAFPENLRDLSTFEAVPFVTYEECDYVFGRWFEANFNAQPSTLTSSSHFTELEEVVDFVACGEGLSIVPRDSVENACARGEVKICYAGRGAPCLNPVYVVMRAGTEPRPLLGRLVELVAEGPSSRS